MNSLLLVLISAAFGAAGQVGFKFGIMQMAQNPGVTLLEKIKWPIVAGLFLYGISTVIWIMALKKLELSYAYPLLSINYIFILLASYFFLHEPISGLRIVGVLFILAGISLVARS